MHAVRALLITSVEITTDLGANQDKDKGVLDKLLTTLIAELSVGSLSSE